jgi:hypothetical protein
MITPCGKNASRSWPVLPDSTTCILKVLSKDQLLVFLLIFLVAFLFFSLLDWSGNFLKHFCVGHPQVEYHMFVWTDQIPPDERKAEKTTYLEIKHRGWPYDSLGRFETYVSRKSTFADFDYLFAIDIDLYLKQDICEEIISDRTATLGKYLWRLIFS